MNRFLYLSLIPILWLPPASAHTSVRAGTETVNIVNETPAIKFANIIETVVIDNVHYDVPPPWAGNRVFPTTRRLDELRQIPPEFTFAGSELYILADAFEPLVAMVTAAGEDGITLLAESTYRSIHYQQAIFIRRLEQGATFAQICRSVAPPGYSQHMLGTAVDFAPTDWTFAETDQYRWLQDHAAEFGFTETYSRTNEMGASWESWHWNYIGMPEETDAEAPGRSDIETETERLN